MKDILIIYPKDIFPWQFLYFFPDPQGQGSFLPIFLGGVLNEFFSSGFIEP